MVRIRNRPLEGTSIATRDHSLEVVYPEWRKSALCIGEDPMKYYVTPGYRSEDQIEEYKRLADACYDCPVMLECEVDAKKYGDEFHTIRAGIIPTVLLGQGRGKPKGGSLVKHGKCRLGHKIRSEDDLLNPVTCIHCHRDYSSKFDRCGNNQETAVAVCRGGHEYTDENIRYSRRVKNGVDTIERRCAICTSERQKLYRLNEKAAKLSA